MVNIVSEVYDGFVITESMQEIMPIDSIKQSIDQFYIMAEEKFNYYPHDLPNLNIFRDYAGASEAVQQAVSSRQAIDRMEMVWNLTGHNLESDKLESQWFDNFVDTTINNVNIKEFMKVANDRIGGDDFIDHKMVPVLNYEIEHGHWINAHTLARAMDAEHNKWSHQDYVTHTEEAIINSGVTGIFVGGALKVVDPILGAIDFFNSVKNFYDNYF